MPSKPSENYSVYHHYKHLDLTLMKELPDSHAWTSKDEHPSCSAVESAAPPPLIDLNEPSALKLVGHACKTWGVFQVINHGIPASLLDNIESAVRSLFSLPIQQKLKAARSPNGVSGYGVAPISSFFPKLMWSEGFTIVGSPLEHARLLWPQDYTNFCEAMKEYEEQMKKLAGRLMWMVLQSLGISKEDIKWAGPKGKFKAASAALQLNSYPACPDPDRTIGLAAHTDSTLLTILHQNRPGLQVLREGVGWVSVPQLPGALVINIGDLLHMLTNGLYPSVLHRAVVNRTQHRVSIAYLYGPPPKLQISPLPKLVDHDHPPLYRPITWSEYLGTKAKHFDKALSSVRLCAPLKKFVEAGEHNRVQVG